MLHWPTAAAACLNRRVSGLWGMCNLLLPTAMAPLETESPRSPGSGCRPGRRPNGQRAQITLSQFVGWGGSSHLHHDTVFDIGP